MSLTVQLDIIPIVPGTMQELQVSAVHEYVRSPHLGKEAQRGKITRLVAGEDYYFRPHTR